MRRWAWAVTAALGTVLVTSPATLCATVASAAPSPAPLPVPSPSPGTVQCTVDKELGGITGLTATANGYAVTVKATSGLALRVYLLDAECRRSGKSLAYNADRGARDPQDIQVAADGTFWVADTGDDPANPARPNVGVWKISRAQIICIQVVPHFGGVETITSSSRYSNPCHRALSVSRVR